jgi:cytoskeletal protein CcmA (bactofilin family)
MWRKDEVKPQGAPQATPPGTANTTFPPASTAIAPASAAPAQSAAPSALPLSPRAAACISQGIRIKGEITGKEDLFVDGTVEGKLDFGSASVTVGPNGKVKADISAREVIVRGTVDGKIEGTEKVQLWNSGRVTGEVRTERLAIEDGALLRGKVEAGKAPSRIVEAKPKSAPADASESGKSNSAAASSRSAVI